MKKITLILLLLLYSCEQSRNQFFISDEIYTTILGNIQEENKKNKNLNFFYIFTKQDTLIVLATSKENEVFPIDRIKKLGAFKYKDNKVIVAESYNPKYNIVKKNNALDDDFINNQTSTGSFDEDIQYGCIYKIITPNNINLIKKGELKEFFIK
nr:hypothetical protein [uncultured Chryseobacterium sp.]